MSSISGVGMYRGAYDLLGVSAFPADIAKIVEDYWFDEVLMVKELIQMAREERTENLRVQISMMPPFAPHAYTALELFNEVIRRNETAPLQRLAESGLFEKLPEDALYMLCGSAHQAGRREIWQMLLAHLPRSLWESAGQVNSWQEIVFRDPKMVRGEYPYLQDFFSSIPSDMAYGVITRLLKGQGITTLRDAMIKDEALCKSIARIVHEARCIDAVQELLKDAPNLEEVFKAAWYDLPEDKRYFA